MHVEKVHSLTHGDLLQWHWDDCCSPNRPRLLWASHTWIPPLSSQTWTVHQCQGSQVAAAAKGRQWIWTKSHPGNNPVVHWTSVEMRQRRMWMKHCCKELLHFVEQVWFLTAKTPCQPCYLGCRFHATCVAPIIFGICVEDSSLWVMQLTSMLWFSLALHWYTSGTVSTPNYFTHWSRQLMLIVWFTSADR
jgi:hypothetical protein